MVAVIRRIRTLRPKRPAVGVGYVAGDSRGAISPQLIYIVTVSIDEAIEGVFESEEEAREFAQHLEEEHVGAGTRVNVRSYPVGRECSEVRWRMRRPCSRQMKVA